MYQLCRISCGRPGTFTTYHSSPLSVSCMGVTQRGSSTRSSATRPELSSTLAAYPVPCVSTQPITARLKV